MSTADPGLDTGVPDADLIQRLANELFLAPPGAASVPAEPFGLLAVAAPLGAAPHPAAASTVQVPVHLGAGGDPLRQAPTSHPAPGGGWSSSALPATPSVTVPRDAAWPGLQPIDLPYADELQSLLSGWPGSASGLPGGLSTKAAPSSSGLPTAPSAQRIDATSAASLVPAGLQAPIFYFLPQQATQLAGIRVPSATDTRASLGASGWGGAQAPFDVHAVRRDFPILRERVNGRPLIWLDNAATTQKPQAVIDRVSYFYEHENSNIHRAAHELAARATDAYEGARETARRFLNARSTNEIVFVRGTTEGINLIAQSWGRQNIGAGDEIVITWLEHHANIVPWQQLAAQTGAVLKVVPVDEDGQVLLDAYQKLLSPRTKLVSFTQVSNALGTVTPAKQIIDLAHSVGAKVLLDGAQSVSHLRADVQALGCDWFVFSGHKVFGPTGIGVVYGREDLLNATEPWQGGGNMIADVTFEKTVYQPAPSRFEAGTGNIADAVGLGAALDYVMRIGLDAIAQYEHGLLEYGTYRLKQIRGVRLIGTAPDKAGVLSFVLAGHTTEEVGRALNQEGIAVRSGHHCAQPILRRFGVEATVRPSFALYNTCADIDALVGVVQRLAKG